MSAQPLGEEHIRFYTAMGRAIAAWAVLEHVLGYFYSACIGGLRPAAVDAFFKMIAFSTKLGAADAAAGATFTLYLPNYLPAWKKLKDKIGAASQDRNEIAHFAVRVEHRKGHLSRKEPDRYPDCRLVLLPPHVAEPADPEKIVATKMWDIARIDGAAERFRVLTQELNDLANGVNQDVTNLVRKQ